MNIQEENVVRWLLEEGNPSTRYFTLKDILGRGEENPVVKDARAHIRSSRIVEKIFSKQNPEGYWQEPYNPYHPKYKSSYWQIMILGQLGLDRSDERLRKACEFIFQFQHEKGGFTSYTKERALEEYKFLESEKKKLPPKDEWIKTKVFEHQYSCLTGNMVAALLRIGYTGDVRVNKALEWLTSIQNEDGGWLCPYWKAHIKDTHSCFYGTICPLEALSEIPKDMLTDKMKKSIKIGVEFLLMHRLYKADHHNYKIINKSWLNLSFPWFYGYNILRGLDVLTKLDYIKDNRLDDALEIVVNKRTNEGKWKLESSPTGRMQANIEKKGKESKWMSLIAMRVLDRIYHKNNFRN